MATGVLPICFGESTKFTQWGLDADKAYTARVRLGISTRTGDAEGEIVRFVNASRISPDDVRQSLAKFRGHIRQIPSMYSALKRKGTPLYKLARRGVEVERQPRSLTINELEMTAFEEGRGAKAQQVEFDIRVACSKGAYIRRLAEDIGTDLGVGAHLAALHRTAAGSFTEDQAVALEELEALYDRESPAGLDRFLLPVDALIGHMPALQIPAGEEQGFVQGQPSSVQDYRFAEEIYIVRVFSASGQFLGVGKVTEDRRIQPKRVLAFD